MKKDNKFKKIILFIFSSLLTLSVAFAGFQVGYRLNNGIIYIKDMTDKGDYGDGYQVINNGDKNYFIPTKTQVEWDSFKNNKPDDVEINSVRDGGWSSISYGSWGGCSKSCGGGTKSRTWSRSCNNHTPLNGGAGCSGASSGTQTTSCNTQSCKTYHWTSGILYYSTYSNSPSYFSNAIYLNREFNSESECDNYRPSYAVGGPYSSASSARNYVINHYTCDSSHRNDNHYVKSSYSGGGSRLTNSGHTACKTYYYGFTCVYE